MLENISILINNPSRGATSFHAGVIKEDLRNKYLKVKNKIECEYYTTELDSFLFKFKIPSLSYDSIKYDVVLKFTPETEDAYYSRSLKKYGIELFSNSPHFIYTFAYVANEEGFLIEELKDKYEKITLTEKPTMRNPNMVFNFEKSIHTSCLHLLNNEILLNTDYLRSHAKKLSNRKLKEVLKDVKDTKTIMQMIKLEQLKERQTRREKVQNKKPTNNVIKSTSTDKTEKNIKKVKKVKGFKTMKRIDKKKGTSMKKTKKMKKK